MVGGGVEATGGAEEFASEFHAGQHFAACFGVVAGGGQNGGDALWGGTVLQEAEDGLTMWGVQRCGREARQVGVIWFREPVDGWNALIGKKEVVGEDGGLFTEGMPGGDEEVVTLVGGIVGE